MQNRSAHMMCTRCYRISVPDTWIGGSEILELIGWCCFVLPGLLYCSWRHFNRIKLCAHCRSTELVREARHSQRAVGAGVGGRLYSGGRSPWPEALQAPRDRLHSGVLVALFAFAVAAAWTLDGVTPGRSPGSALLASCLALAGSSWVAAQLLRHRGVRGWEAWDEHGNRVAIEVG